MVVEERPSYDKETGAFTGTSTYERPYEEAPGISPLLVAEVLDHAIFFSLGDLGKALPQYEEIALPVEMDADCYEQYDRTRQQLKDYLIARRWEGDTTFRGAYLQWAMGWPNAAYRPHEVIHNIKHPITGEKLPHVVTSIPSYGEDRVYAKEQALIDLLRSELEQNRPCVIYIRQTSTRDIQPRIETLLRQHIPLARTFILKNTVEAEQREAVIEAEVAKGTNVVISNPELVKTGLDLVFAPTLIFYEITFNLGTMMQAAGRSYRLNQTHTHCKTYYLFCEGTMEQTAVQLMSRKQRAAKLLTGDIGLTGLDAVRRVAA
jgi:SNF2 family DNA or RNA helicase